MFFRSFVGKHGLIAVFGIDILRGGRDAWHKKVESKHIRQNIWKVLYILDKQIDGEKRKL